ncbi:acetyl-CoA carboxylase, carboxyltransferase subunit beta [Flavobacteriales bacterium]|jgi:acetyl-CoA carboxylase carboxyl transferase subunit beta|nr:acetyl-CoA carboxylase, carboxyltransferase subunit beta [Flavobacteriales bacterium]
MGWFKRIQDGITTKSTEKKEIPEGAWHQCVNCKTVVTSQQHADRIHVCTYCGHHDRVGSEEYFELLFDEGKYREVAPKIESEDPLKFNDTKSYSSRLAAAKKKTGLTDALRTASGDLEGIPVVISCMDFQFIGGSMGSVVGEKIARGIDLSLKKGCPFICISKSGGARMMEAGLSLMQMAKTSAKLSLLAKAGLPYISVLTDPTTGGVTASFAMLGDMNIAEPNALIGFAGPRVVKETIGKDLPEGFQRSEFLLEHGFLDAIVERKDLKEKIAFSLKAMYDAPEASRT